MENCQTISFSCKPFMFYFSLLEEFNDKTIDNITKETKPTAGESSPHYHQYHFFFVELIERIIYSISLNEVNEPFRNNSMNQPIILIKSIIYWLK